MSWLDLVLMLLVAGLTALGAKRRLAGFLVGIGGVLLLRPLLVLSPSSPFAALLIALVAGLALNLLGRRLLPPTRGTAATLPAFLGGFGGFAIGLSVVLAMATALPIERNSLGQIVYPPRDLSQPIGKAVTSSHLARLGRDILLYPLLDAQGDVASAERGILRGLHDYLVVGTPWEGSE